MKELVIIGHGPAGISAALYAVRGGAPVTILAKDDGALANADTIQNYYGFERGISAKELIKDGFVTVNGAACFERGKKLRGGDTVSCGGMTVTVFKRNEN